MQDTLTYGWAVFLGFIQGMTEFLPVSSSAHLALAEHLGKGVVENMAYDILLHLATVIAVFGAFYKDISAILREPQKRIVIGYVICGSIPAGIIGILFKDYIEGLAGNPVIICCCLLLTALMLFSAQKLGDGVERLENTGFKRAFYIGCFQVLGMFPGVSRSGSTISGGLIFSLKREAAVKFSFFLMVPAVLGANLLKVLKDPQEIFSLPFAPAFLGFAVALVSGFIAAKWMLKIVQQNKLIWFALYCALAGICGIVYFGIIKA